MIVVCTGCSAKFRVADEKVGPRGAKLRCSKCKTVFTVQRPAEVPPAAAPAPAADPFAEGQRRSAPPPLPRRPTTLDARAAFDVDLEPQLGGPPSNADPFAPPPAGAALDADPFAPGAPGADPFGAPVAPHDAAPPGGTDEGDPFVAAAATGGAAAEEFGAPPAEVPGMAWASSSGSLALEELTTPPMRRLPPPSAGSPLLGAVEEPFGGGSSLGPVLSELDDGVLATATAPGGTLPRPFLLPRPAPEPEPPLQLDPFTAAAVAADPLAVGEPSRKPGPGLPEESIPERPVTVRSFRFRDVLVSAMALAALLVLALGILVVWRGGLAPADAFRPSAVLAVLAPRPPSGAVAVSGVTSGLYERARGAPLLFVRGTVTSTSARPLVGVQVIVEVVRGGEVLARGAVPVGAVPGPEALHGVGDAAALARVLADAAVPGGARLAPGASAPFLVAFADDLPSLAGASLRVRPVAGTE